VLMLSWAERNWIDLFRVDAIELVGLVRGTILLLWEYPRGKCVHLVVK